MGFVLRAIPVFIVFAVVYFLWQFRGLFAMKTRCTNCKSTNLHRMPRTDWEKWIGRFVECRKFRCPACGWMGLVRTAPRVEVAHGARIVEPATSSSIEIMVHTDDPGLRITPDLDPKKAPEPL